MPSDTTPPAGGSELDPEKIRLLHTLAMHPDQSPCDAIRLDQYLGRHALSIAAALEELAALRKDRERLDWLSERDRDGDLFRLIQLYHDDTEDLRDLIDQARTAKGGDE